MAAATAEAHLRGRGDPARVAQLAEIREIIAEVQSDDAPPPESRDDRHGNADLARASDAQHAARTATPPAVGPAVGTAVGGAVGTAARQKTELRRADEPGVDEPGHAEAPDDDPLRRRLAEHDARAARELEERERLRRSMHERRDDAERGSGAFLAGFLLVVVVAAAMLAAYLMRDEIVARWPESAPMLDAFVAAMDDLRVAIREGYDRARAWVLDLVAAA
jgi:hypothetical protein